MYPFLVVLSALSSIVAFIVFIVVIIFRFIEGRFPHTPWLWFKFDNDVMFLHENIPEFERLFKLHDLEKNVYTLERIMRFFEQNQIVRRNKEITYWEFSKVMKKIRVDIIFIRRIGLYTIGKSSNYLYMNNGSRSVIDGINRQRYLYFISKLDNNVLFTNKAIELHNLYTSKSKQLPLIVDTSNDVNVKSHKDIINDVVDNSNSDFEMLVNKYKSKE